MHTCNFHVNIIVNSSPDIYTLRNQNFNGFQDH